MAWPWHTAHYFFCNRLPVLFCNRLARFQLIKEMRTVEVMPSEQELQQASFTLASFCFIFAQHHLRLCGL